MPQDNFESFEIYIHISIAVQYILEFKAKSQDTHTRKNNNKLCNFDYSYSLIIVYLPIKHIANVCNNKTRNYNYFLFFFSYFILF